eukprot:TRINITY_DN22962_c0_g1_i2.p1 TRINITY_DN22962_c0_g1~~TRINITY_DN22962_c0_g1_i2.p1  ORF type:complete len:287 (-),score=76.86 TRINITY_DN22962_c0_g1_i2:339-1199(-)
MASLACLTYLRQQRQRPCLDILWRLGARRFKQQVTFWRGDEETIIIRPPGAKPLVKARNYKGKRGRRGNGPGDIDLMGNEVVLAEERARKEAAEGSQEAAPPSKPWLAKMAEPLDTAGLDLIRSTQEVAKLRNALNRRYERIGDTLEQGLRAELERAEGRLADLRGSRSAMKLRRRDYIALERHRPPPVTNLLESSWPEEDANQDALLEQKLDALIEGREQLPAATSFEEKTTTAEAAAEPERLDEAELVQRSKPARRGSYRPPDTYSEGDTSIFDRSKLSGLDRR